MGFGERLIVVVAGSAYAVVIMPPLGRVQVLDWSVGCFYAGTTAHPPGLERTPRTAKRARLTAAASSRQS